jgi:transcriptional regulator with XRE-family HTH domain
MNRKDKEIGKRIKKLRVYLGLTQRDFAEKIYSSYRSVQNWESGERYISESNLRLLIDEYGVSREWLLTGTGEMLTDEASFYELCKDRLLAQPMMFLKTNLCILPTALRCLR